MTRRRRSRRVIFFTPKLNRIARAGDRNSRSASTVRRFEFSRFRPGIPRTCYNPPMRRRSRIRRVAKWTGLALCVLVVVAWGMSMIRTIAWGQVNGMAVRLSGLTEGCAGTVIIRIRPINVELTNLGPRGLTVTPWTPARSPRGSRFGI